MRFFNTYFFLAISVLFLFIAVKPTLAHFQDADHGYTSILHVNPDDSPIVGEDTTLVLFITDPKNTFSFDNCNCELAISGNDGFNFHTILSETGEAHAVFPSKGVYKATFTGTNVKGKSLFKFSYDIRVEREVVHQRAQDNTLVVGHMPYLMCMALCVIVVLGLIFLLKNNIWGKPKKSR